jgi:hypothetical protein
MRVFLVAVWACACVACVAPESDLDEARAGIWDDDAHCPDIPPAGGDETGGGDSGGPGPKPDPKNCTNLGLFRP